MFCNISFNGMCLYAECDLELQVKHQKKLRHLCECVRISKGGGVLKVPLSFQTSLQDRPEEAFRFQEQTGCFIGSKLEATVYLRPVRLQQRQSYCTKRWSSPGDASRTAGARGPRRQIPVQMLPANSLTFAFPLFFSVTPSGTCVCVS